LINLVIVVDSLRYDSYTILMPNMKELAGQGLEFTDARSMGSTTARSHSTIVGEKVSTSCLKKGYKSMLLHSNAILSKSSQISMESRDLDIFTKQVHPTIRNIRSVVKGNYNVPYKRADHIIDKALSNLNDRTVIFTWYMDVHTPYYPSKLKDMSPLDRLKALTIGKKIREHASDRDQRNLLSKSDHDFYRSLYDMEVSELDEKLGDFCKTLDMRDEPYRVIFTSDHGEEFLENRQYGHNIFKDTEELRHVPLFVYNSDRKERVVDENRFYLEDFHKVLRTIL